MDTVSILSSDSLGKNFIPDEFIKKGEDEYYYRNQQLPRTDIKWRNLKSYEVEGLVKNNNTAENWDEILVTDEFDTRQIKNNDFYGLVRIGSVRKAILEHHGQRLPVGITDSVVIACDIGDDVAIHNVPYLAHYIIGNRCILTNIDEIHVSNHAKFGNGIVKEGEPESVRVWLDIMNETGARKILPSDKIITADAYLWAKYRDDSALQEKLKEITQNSYNNHRGFYGTIGEQTVIKNSRIIKDVKIGSNCYIKGANKLKNLTIQSTKDEPTQIGEGVELVNGIIGFGCKVFYGCKAVRFILGNNSNLKYGARLINSFLGDNSTISCCEVLNNLIFPSHEQHHNNSFLISSVIFGQSNMAAGCTIGSNHNSRANDSELVAGRGFWPGLCSSVKHSCKFASFVLLAKADYPAELNIPLPFSLLNINVSRDTLEVFPAYWWLHNMFALERNTSKFLSRDKRKQKIQNIEYDSLAPDTIEEIITSLSLLRIWTARAVLGMENALTGSESSEQLEALGKIIIEQDPDRMNGVEVLGEKMEKSKRPVVILKVKKAYAAYKDMMHIYAVRNLADYLEAEPDKNFNSLKTELKGARITQWVNLGGQLIPENSVDSLRNDIGTGKLNTWEDIHSRYNELWSSYKKEKQSHSYSVLCYLYETNELTKEQWLNALNKSLRIQEYICEQVYDSRKKDYDNPYRQATFRNEKEMTATIGDIEKNSFVLQVRRETEEFRDKIEKIIKREN